METKNFKTIFLPYKDKLGKTVEIKKIEKEIQEATPDTLASLQTRYQQLLAARSELSRTLGDRVVNPK